MIPMTAHMPVPLSSTDSGTRIGAPSPLLTMSTIPEYACSSGSYAGSSFFGPFGPNPLISQYTRPGLSSRSRSVLKPALASAPGRKFWTRTSAEAINRSRTSRPR